MLAGRGRPAWSAQSGCELVLACVVGALTLCWTLWLATFLFVWCGWCGWWPLCRCWGSLRLALTCCQRVWVRPCIAALAVRVSCLWVPARRGVTAQPLRRANRDQPSMMHLCRCVDPAFPSLTYPVHRHVCHVHCHAPGGSR